MATCVELLLLSLESELSLFEDSAAEGADFATCERRLMARPGGTSELRLSSDSSSERTDCSSLGLEARLGRSCSAEFGTDFECRVRVCRAAS